MQQLRNDNKRFVAEVIDQLAQALNLRHNKELPHLLARTKQLRMEHDQLLLEHKKILELLGEKEEAVRQEITARTKL